MDFYIDGGGSGGGSFDPYNGSANGSSPGVGAPTIDAGTGGINDIRYFYEHGAPAFSGVPVPSSAFITNLDSLGLKPITSGVVDQESSLRAEYGIPVNTYSGTSYTPSTYSGLVGDSGWIDDYNTQGSVYNGTTLYDRTAGGTSSAYFRYLADQARYDASQRNYSSYNKWLNSQKSAYNNANNEYQKFLETNNVDGFPKPWMPSNPPNFIDGDESKPEFPELKPYNPLKSDWNGKVDLSGLAKGLMGLLMGSGGSTNNMQVGSSEYPYFGQVRTQTSQQDQSAKPQDTQALPWQSKNLIKPASYLDESSQGIAPPKGLMGQDMITQNNVLPALQMALMNNQGVPEGNEALDAATKPLSDAKDKGNATDKIQEARDKWKSKSLNKLANWQSLA